MGERKRSRDAGLWLKNPDVYRRLKRPSVGPAAAPPIAGAHASPPISVGAFESDAAHVLQWLEVQAEAACACLGLQADEARIDASDLRLRQLPNPQDELSFLAVLEEQRQQQQQEQQQQLATGSVVQQQQQQLEGAVTPGSGAGEVGSGNPMHARPRPAEGHLFAMISRQQEEERARAAQFLHSAREAQDTGTSVRLPQAPQPPPVAAPAAADCDNGTGSHVRGDGVIITVAVCESRHDHKNILAELQLLGSCTLAQLQDAIRCPSSALVASAGARAPSSYFFIAGRFYSDSSGPAAMAAGERVAAFCREANVRAPLHLLQPGGTEGDAAVGAEQHHQQQQQQRHEAPEAGPQQSGGAAPTAPAPPPTAPLSAVTLADLSLCVSNRPTYLFSHAGCCEHGWFVTDIRLRHARDPPPAPGAYPRSLYTAPPSARWRCGACSTSRAAVLVSGHPDAPDDPCLLCPGCRDLLLPPGSTGGGGGGGGGGGNRPPYKVYNLGWPAV